MVVIVSLCSTFYLRQLVMTLDPSYFIFHTADFPIFIANISHFPEKTYKLEMWLLCIQFRLLFTFL